MVGPMIRHFLLTQVFRITQITAMIFISGMMLSCSMNRLGPTLPPTASIQDIRVAEGTEKTVVEVEAEEPMIYTTFHLSNPDRLVIDLAEVSLAQFSDEIQLAEGPIRAIRPGTGGGRNVSRLEFELSGQVETDVRTEGVNLVVEVTQLGVRPKGFIFFEDKVVSMPEVSPEETDVATVSDNLADKTGEISSSDTGMALDLGVEPISPPPLIPNMVGSMASDEALLEGSERREDVSANEQNPMLEPLGKPESEKPPLQNVEVLENEKGVGSPFPLLVEDENPLPPAKKVASVRFEPGDPLKLIVRSDGHLSPRPFFIGLGRKRRLVIDLPGVTMPSLKSRIPVADPRVKRVRVGQHKKKLRLVLDLIAPISYSLQQGRGELRVVIHDPSAPKEEMIESPTSKSDVLGSEDSGGVGNKGNEALGGNDPINTDVASEDSGMNEKSLTAIVPNPDLASAAEFPSALPIPVLEAEVDTDTDVDTNVVTTTDTEPDTEVENLPQEEPTMKAKAEEPGTAETPFPIPTEDASVEKPMSESEDMISEIEKENKENKRKVFLREKRREAAKAKRDALELVSTASAEKEDEIPDKYKGRKISLDFQDAEVTNVIRLLADVSGLNFVMGEDVKGKITIKMNDVPWDQALELILEIRNLGMVHSGDIIRIATLANLTQQRNEKALAKETEIKAETLLTRVVYINYAKADQMRNLLLKLLSSRGEIMVATRINALVVKDIEENLGQIEQMADKLDTKTPQVLIEARIVEVQPTFKRSLGVRWGADFKTNSGGNRIGIGNALPGSGVFGQAPDFSVNVPAASPLGGIGFSFGRFTESPFQLDLRISAGESQEMTRIVSTPKIMVLDNNEATIKQGSQIPFASQSANGGTNVQLVDASLQLKVIPHISSDGGILLELDLTKNEPGPQLAGSENPSIFEKEVKTQVLLMDGETMVIGGIYETKNTESESGIPLLKDIPGLGWLFKNKEKSTSTTELLIFLTPTIME